MLIYSPISFLLGGEATPAIGKASSDLHSKSKSRSVCAGPADVVVDFGFQQIAMNIVLATLFKGNLGVATRPNPAI